MSHSIPETALEEIYTFALDLGRRAGKILLNGVEQRTGQHSGRSVGVVEEKMNAVDIVRLCHGLSPLWFAITFDQNPDGDSNLRSRRQI